VKNSIVCATVALLLAISPVPVRAQWLNYKTPGIPRTTDGKPDLAAPAPRTPDGKPDFTGVWQIDDAKRSETTKGLESLKPQPWAAALSQKRKEEFYKDIYSTTCLPPGPLVTQGVGRVVQTPNLFLMLFEGTLYREIFLDGRPLPEIVNPDWMGYSVGHWEEDTLVIESAGFNDRTWLDFEGHPHTEALRVTERLRRPDFGHLEIRKTLADPGALVEPWTVPVYLELNADNDPLEYVCNENERDRPHLVGKASDDKSVAVAPEALSKYVGTYELKSPTTGRVTPVEITLSGDQLFVGGAGPKTPLKARSETEFSAPFGNFQFPGMCCK
jgi:hypothetical protein